jgi:perosamine synthetase
MIPVNEPLIGRQEIRYVRECLKTGWISSEGRFIPAFEEAFAAAAGRRFGVAVNNGTNALILALRSLDLPAGSEVILPTFTIISCALACIYNNLVPVFVDAEPDTWTMDPGQIDAAVGPKTKAIMAVHIYGHPANMAAIESIAARHHLAVVEDFAEGIGSEYGSKRCGSFGIISCASFYANKLVSTGEGGICLTDDEKLAGKMRQLRNLAFLPGQRFVHKELGFNFRMTNIQAAIGLGQLENFDSHLKKKFAMAARYRSLLARLEQRGSITLPVEKQGTVNSYWMFGILLTKKSGRDAAAVIHDLAGKGIQSRPFFFPMHRQPAFRPFPWFQETCLPVSEELYRFGFYLPSGLTLRREEQAQVTAALEEILQ